MNRKLLSGLTAQVALSAGLALAGPANAQVSAQGQITGLSYELIDLTPDDGLAPTASWLNGSSLISGEIVGDPSALPFNAYLPSAGGPLSAALSGNGSQAMAQVGASGLAAGGSSGGGGFYASAMTGYGLDFGGILLGANTGLRLSLSYQLDAAVSGLAPGCLSCDNAQVNLTVLMLGSASAAPVFHTAYAAAYADLGPAADSVGDTLQLQLDNASADAITVSTGLTLIAQGQSFATPVPEPTPAALLLAGLGLLGGLAARRGTGAAA